MRNWKKHKPSNFNYKGRWILNWFSNMTLVDLYIDGKIWPSSENYFQAMKSLKEKDRERIRNLTPQDSKQEGKKVELRPDWEVIKEHVMIKALLVKFAPGTKQRELLDKTAPDPVIEWNNWNDKEWGVDVATCLGDNLLGIALTNIRDNYDVMLKENQDFFKNHITPDAKKNLFN